MEKQQNRENYYEDGQTWEQEVVTNAIQSKNRAWIITFCSLGLALLSLVTLILLLPLKTFEPYIITVDQSTGYVEMTKGLYGGKDLSEDDAVTQSNLVRYVSAKEQYNTAVLKKNYDLKFEGYTET